jgi:hypothetical protein
MARSIDTPRRKIEKVPSRQRADQFIRGFLAEPYLGISDKVLVQTGNSGLSPFKASILSGGPLTSPIPKNTPVTIRVARGRSEVVAISTPTPRFVPLVPPYEVLPDTSYTADHALLWTDAVTGIPTGCKYVQVTAQVRQLGAAGGSAVTIYHASSTSAYVLRAWAAPLENSYGACTGIIELSSDQKIAYGILWSAGTTHAFISVSGYWVEE